MRRISTALLTAVVASVVLAGCAGAGGAQDDENFYADHDIEIFVPFGPGGGTDVTARLMAQFMPQFIEGSPAVQVYNEDGAAGVPGTAKFIKTGAKDGSELLMSSNATHLAYAFGERGVTFDFSSLEPVAGFGVGAVAYARTDAGINSVQDLIDRDRPLQYAGQSASGGDLNMLLAFDLLDIDVNVVLGYEGRGPARLAFESGEADINYDNTSAYFSSVKPMVEAGDAIPLFTYGQYRDGGVVREEAFPDLPTVAEVYEELYGEEPSGPIWDAYLAVLPLRADLNKVLWIPSEVSEATKRALIDGVVAMFADKEFVAAKQEALGDEMPLTGADLEAAVDVLKNTDPDSDEFVWLRNWLTENYQVQF